MAWPGQARAASVGPSGYTNDFSAQPPAADWATVSIAGTPGEVYDLDTDIATNLNVAVATISFQVVSNVNNPASQLTNATWSSVGLYLQTRPNNNRYTILLGKFVNNTGSNATQVAVSYQLTMTGTAIAEDAGKGTHVFYSLTGAAGSWLALPSLNNLTNAGSYLKSTNLAVNWVQGVGLYLLWADDNGTTSTDTPNQIDNFSLRVTAGANVPLTVNLTAPTNGAVLIAGPAFTASAAVAYGTAPHTVEYFMSSGAGNTAFTPVGSSLTPPFNVSLGALAVGTYNLYARVTDNAGSPEVARSTTNTFYVAETITLTLAAPADGANLDYTANVTGLATVAGGTAPYSVQFLLDGVNHGLAVSSPPYQHDFGTLAVGDHAIRAAITDARGWVSNSVAHTVHISGPLAVSFFPVNGAAFIYGSSISITGAPVGGSAPYAADFYLNNQLVVSIPAAPFTTNLGALPVGSYTGYVHAADRSAPVPQQSFSPTNVFTVTPNPLVVTLTAPTNGQSGVAGVAIALSATASVGAPLTITNVEFFYDGSLVGVDGSAPFTNSLASPGSGPRPFYAVAVDNVGRRATSAVVIATFTLDPLANDNFVNRLDLGTPTHLSGNNTGATTEGGEPTFQFGGGQPTILWGATLWFKWLAPFDGTVTMDTFGSSMNTVLSVYTGTTVGGLAPVQRNDNANGSTLASLVSFNAVAGTEYQIQLGGQGGFGSPVSTGAFQLNLTMPPFAAITSPLAGAAFLAGSNILVNVTSASPSGTVTNLSLYRGANFIGSAGAPSASFVVSNAPVGSNSLYAVATDSSGQVGTSAVVRVFVANLGITITTPADDSIFTGTKPITAAAFAALSAGAITNVDFFLDGELLGRSAAAPYTAIWSNVIGGSHRLTATGLDDSGNAYLAAAVNFGVASGLVRSNSVWKYLDNGSNQGTNWIAPDFDDSSWLSGPAELGYGDGDEATVVASGPAGAFYITTYFRRSFMATNLAGLTNLLLSLEYDDAGVVYLNGREIYRTPNMPAGQTYTTVASGQGIEDTLAVISRSPTNLIEGVNVLAVEIHQQSATSTDLSFNLDLLAIPVVSHNLSPEVAITSPTNTQFFVAPPSVAISANASDSDGSVTKVEFYADGVKLGESASGNPYQFTWNNPPVGAHVLTAVATDNQNVRMSSRSVPVVVYDTLGTPVAAITSPANGAVIQGPTNLLITATANAINGVTNVQFITNGVVFANDATPPYSVLWPSSFLSNRFQVVVFDANGVTGTSALVGITITIPPTNVLAPTIATQLPPAYATITNLTNLTVTFSERVQNVDASDLLINGLPATSVVAAPNGSNYTFHFPHPAYGQVDITFAGGHGITDFGFPGVLPFNSFDEDAVWSYQIIDRTPPRVATKTPGAGVTVTNLTEVAVTFSEEVSGVDAADLLVNGEAAFGLSGSGSNYVFNVAQPGSGPVTITWATSHGIYDFADIPNGLRDTNAVNTWSFTLDSRTTFVQSNSTWRFIKGLAEASTPTNAWRQRGFDDSSWSNAAAPFFFGDPYTNYPAGIVGTHLTDMRSNYSSIYLRKEFVVQNRGLFTNLLLTAQSDDGYIAWINGVEIRRYFGPAGSDPSYQGVATGSAPENNNNASYILGTLGTNAIGAMINGTNVLAIQAFNEHLTNADFAFNLQLYSFLPDTTVTPPRLVSANPPRGDLFSLTNIVITFSEDVTNVDASDLLVNGVAAASVVVVSNSVFSFRFPQPPYGSVAVTWATNHGIVDLDPVPKSFDGNTSSAKLNYQLINPSAPIVTAQAPVGSTTITGLTSITVTFSEPVTGVDAADLLLNGQAATGLSALTGSNYLFTVPQPTYGAVSVRFRTNSGITDLELPPTDLDSTRPSNQWNYTLINPVPTATLTSSASKDYVLQGVNVTLTATASDNDGTIAQVEFLVSGSSLGTVLAPPYSLVLSNLELGSYTLNAVATDNSGLRGTSAPVMLHVVTTLPIFLLRGPYLQSGSSTGGVVRWRTDQFSDGVVHYGTSLDSLTNVAVQATVTNNHIVRVGGLQPETKYFYSFGSSAQILAGGSSVGGSNYWFTTAPVPGTMKPTRFWALGDPGTANDNQRAVRDSYYNLVANGGKPADFWLMLGDNAYNSGTDTEHQSAVFDMYPETLRNYFLFPVLGNHETAQSTSTTITYPYLDIFSNPQNGEAGGLPSGNPKYYSYDYANIHFVALDSMTSGRETNSPMVLWLKDDLGSTTQTWTIVYFHHSLYTKGTHDSDTESDLVQMRQNFNPILEAYGVDLVLMGHSHVYERSYLLDGHYGLSSTLTPSMKIDAGNGREDGTGAYTKNAEDRGVVYSIVGSSGQALGGPLNHPAHVVSINLLGSLLVDVSSNRLDAMFLTSTGTTNDHYTLIKRTDAPPATPINVTAAGLGTNQIQITWTDVATNELGYIIERSLDGTLYIRLATNGPNTTSFINGGLLANTTYYYRVRAFNGGGESAASNVGTGSTVVPSVLAAAVNAATGARSLILVGAPGLTYVIEKTTTLSNAASWQTLQSVTLSNASQTIDVSAGTNAPTIFYRARR